MSISLLDSIAVKAALGIGVAVTSFVGVETWDWAAGKTDSWDRAAVHAERAEPTLDSIDGKLDTVIIQQSAMLATQNEVVKAIDYNRERADEAIRRELDKAK
jgi:hypothetical protein